MIVDILLTIHFILLILISLRVLSRHDLTSPARLAWIVILFILPYFGVLIYWMFGEVVENWPLSSRIWNNIIATMGPVL